MEQENIFKANDTKSKKHLQSGIKKRKDIIKYTDACSNDIEFKAFTFSSNREKEIRRSKK